MIDDHLEKLAETFRKFPGIGPRQARRFVFFLLYQDNDYRQKLTEEIIALGEKIKQCSDCRRFFAGDNGTSLCDICSNKQIDRRYLMIVEKDVDLYNIHQAHIYNGLYFILGGLLPLTISWDDKIKSLEYLIERIKKETDLEEIIIALSASTEGDHTAEIIKQKLSQFKDKIKISILGRGLSTGTELEYSDPETIKNALKNKSIL